MLIAIAGILITIFLIVGIHEFSHFAMARLLGIKVLRFSIGFGKALYGWHDKSGTEYVIAAVPLGGYVKMLDEQEGPVNKDQLHLAFNRQPLYKRFLVVLAGPFSNFIFALLIYWFLFVVGFTSMAPVIGKVQPNSIAAKAGIASQQEIISLDHIPTVSWTSVVIRLLTHTGNDDKIQMVTRPVNRGLPQTYTLDLNNWQLDELQPDPLKSLGIIPYPADIPLVIGHIQPRSYAAKSSLRMGDRLLSVNKKPLTDWDEVFTEIEEHPNQILTFNVLRGSSSLNINVQTGYERDIFLRKHGFLGIAPRFEWPKEFIRHNQYSIPVAFKYAWRTTTDFSYLNILLIGKLITGKISLKSLGGPITIFSSAGTALNMGMAPFLNFIAFLSISIGIINILPIPGLDGGHILFQFIELILRKPVSPAVQDLSFRLGFIFLIMLMVQAVFNDILRL